jgi:hypothetical protein
VRLRGVAAITALWFVVCGVLAMRHEASTAHVRDRAGGYVHAPTVNGHRGETADLHGQDRPDAEAGDCALLTAAHQAASAQISAPVLVGLAAALRADPPLRLAAAASLATAVYRLAPKTSPPAAV